MPTGQYCITNPTLALILEDGHHVAHTIPIGALINVTDDAFNGKSLVDVEWSGRTVMMFAQDLRARTERAHKQSAPKKKPV